jgi:oxygen-dependent protoporphyrinogen oxidase
LNGSQPYCIAVLGGGISGLSAAYSLAHARRQGAPIEVILLEAGARLGGIIHTEEVNGFIVEGGPDSFLAEKPEAAELCRDLGLGDSLIGSNDRERRTYVLHNSFLHRNQLVPLPDGLALFVPTKFWSMLATPLLPLSNKLAIAANWFKQPHTPGAKTYALGPKAVSASDRFADRSPQNASCDESVAGFVARHFGDAMVENIADPLLAGIFGGDSARLSVRSALPRFFEMEAQYGNLRRAIIQSGKEREHQSQGTAGPLFLSLKEGMETLVSALTNRLDDARVLLGKRVVRIEPRQNWEASGTGAADVSASKCRRYRICCGDGTFYEADALIVALPAHESCRLVSEIDPSLAQELAGISYTSAMMVALGYGPGVREKLPKGFGFLVPRKEKRRLLACTFVHHKFDYRVPAGHALIRCFFGGARDPDVLYLGDEEVLALLKRELGEILRVTLKPEFSRVFRWLAAMPQYDLGHATRLSRIETRLKQHAGLFLAGNIYTGVGISDCIRSGRSAAERALSMSRGG